MLQQGTGTKIRALIVDDFEDILNVMSRALGSSQGIEVIGSARVGAAQDVRPGCHHIRKGRRSGQGNREGVGRSPLPGSSADF